MAGKFADRAASLFGKAKEKAAELKEESGPLLEKAKERATELKEKAEPKITEFREKAEPKISEARQKITEGAKDLAENFKGEKGAANTPTDSAATDGDPTAQAAADEAVGASVPPPPPMPEQVDLPSASAPQGGVEPAPEKPEAEN